MKGPCTPPDEERDFQELYRKPGVRHLGIACTLGSVTTTVYYLLDGANAMQTWTGGAQSLRLALIALSASVALLCFRNARIAVTGYSWLFCITAILFASIGLATSIARHRYSSATDLAFAVDMTFAIILVFIYGFSRLSAAQTVAVAGACALGCIGVLIAVGTVPNFYVRRVATHLTIISIVCAWTRWSIERRERELFDMALENLRRNKHTRELEAAIQAAREADATKAKFLAHMSHEIRTPMNGVLQILELIGNRTQGPDKELIDKGRRAGRALLHILNGVLDYAKLSHQGVSVRPTLTDLRETCRTSAHLHEATATVKNIELRTDLKLPGDGNANVLVDEVKLLEIINNLVANGIKFTDQGYVSLEMQLVRQPEGRAGAATLQIVVADSGPGMEPHELRQAFTPFFQSGSSARRAGGAGLGLAIVRQLVDEMRGTVSAESTSGRGSAFHVALPVERVTLSGNGGSPRPSARPLPSASGEFQGRRVLLVDDNELNADLAAQVLGMLGFDVDVADSGAVAISRLEVGGYDVVLMDCQMPGMDGYETVRVWRRSEGTDGRRRTPIVAVTAYTLLGDRRKCLEAGMDDFLGKPYTAKELASTLRRWLPSPREALDLLERRNRGS